MKTLLIAAVAAATFGAALPAAAQAGYVRGINDRVASHPGVDDRQAAVGAAIERAARRGRLDRAELQRVRVEYRDIAQLERRYARNGLSAWERNDLHRRLGHLEVVVRNERTDRDVAHNRYR